MARPTLLTAELTARLAQAIREGNFGEVAARAAGVGVRTFYRWLRRGKDEESGPYCEFRQAIMQALSDAETSAVRQISQSGDLHHLRWFLERRFPERWSSHRKEILELRKRISELEGRLSGLLRTLPEAQTSAETTPQGVCSGA